MKVLDCYFYDTLGKSHKLRLKHIRPECSEEEIRTFMQELTQLPIFEMIPGIPLYHKIHKALWYETEATLIF